MVADVPRELYDAQRARAEPAVRGRARHAARRGPWHVSVRHLVSNCVAGAAAAGAASGRSSCITCSASPRRTRRAWASGPFPTELEDESRRAARNARQRIRLHHGTAAALRLVRRGGAEALDPDQRRLGPVRDEARRARRHGRGAARRRLRCRGGQSDILPFGAEMLAECEPVYETLPGWAGSTVGVTRFEDLPVAAQSLSQRAWRRSAACRSTSFRPERTAMRPSCAAIRSNDRKAKEGRRRRPLDSNHANRGERVSIEPTSPWLSGSIASLKGADVRSQSESSARISPASRLAE